MDDFPNDLKTSHFSQTCIGCGREFYHLNAFSHHTRNCRLKKKRMAVVIETAQELYRNKKQRRLQATQGDPLGGVANNESNSESLLPTPGPSEASGSMNIVVNWEDTSLSLAQRRPRRENRRMPARFRDEYPKPQAALPPPVSFDSFAPHLTPSPSLTLRIRKVLKSPLNAFGLYRQYHADDFPSHDPEAETNYTGLSEVPSDHRESPTFPPESTFFPYPNENAFLLGEWYWNGGAHKTQKNFKELTDIVGRPDFKSEDVRDIPWSSINKALGDSTDSDDMWLDEPDAGWIETPISISVPFHRFTHNPGPQEYVVPSFRHRSIVSTLKEKMANPKDFVHFHFEPYELWWKKGTPERESTRVYGELYTSSAFLTAYEEIQILEEPGCILPHVLVGLMFGSDSTHLTSFGSSSLWPCYLYFGNESKYRRSKPSCKLGNHIAYFQKVSPRSVNSLPFH
jgi:hypothetical protein